MLFRVAPIPLYNSYMDVFRFGSIIKESIKSIKQIMEKLQ